jgi:hypothetical protein
MYQSQLEGLEVRCNLVLRALRFFYLSLGAFDASARRSSHESYMYVLMNRKRQRRTQCK